MIHLTRLNHERFVLNSDLIEHIEARPDTVISLITGQKLMVQESCEAVIERVVAYRRSIFGAGPRVTQAAVEEARGQHGGE